MSNGEKGKRKWWEWMMPPPYQTYKSMQGLFGLVGQPLPSWLQGKTTTPPQLPSQLGQALSQMSMEEFSRLYNLYLNRLAQEGILEDDEIQALADYIDGLLDKGIWGTGGMMQIPRIGDFITQYAKTTEAFTPEEQPFGGEVIAPGVIWNGQEYVDEKGRKINPQSAQAIIENWWRKMQPPAEKGVTPEEVGGKLKTQQWFQQDFAQQMRGMAQEATRREEAAFRAGLGEQAQLWEMQKQQQLAQLDNPIDWIERYQLAKKKNPFRTPRLPEEQWTTSEQAQQSAAAALDVANRYPYLADFPEEVMQGYPGELAAINQLLRNQATQRSYQESETQREAARLAYYGGELPTAGKPHGGQEEIAPGVFVTGTEGVQPPPLPPGMPLPPWLTGLYPQRFQGTREINEKRKRVTKPFATFKELKAQKYAPLPWGALMNLTPTQQQQWFGLARFAGQDPEELMLTMRQQLLEPKRPTQRSTSQQRTWV